MDEMHLAAKCNQTIHKTLKELGYLDKQFLLDHDIKILEFTATPDGTRYDLMKWNDNSCIIKMKNGLEYKGSYEYKNNQLKQYKNLLEDDNISELVKEINNYLNSYHIIRTRKDKIDDIAYSLDKCQKYNYIYYDQKMKTNINDILEVKPDKNTIIFIKEKLWCAKSIVKKYIGVCYERLSYCSSDSSIIQGLLGRITGYEENKHIIIYTNIETVLKYQELWNSSFKNNKIIWNSETTKYINGN
jgi:hypothetical protein